MTKEHILEEIRRLAKASSGVPPGVRKFYTETGIKQYDWCGKYWVRWSEAIREAGLPPNQKNEAYSDESLITNLVALTREIGRFPVRGDILMKARNDDAFPSEKVFRRFGTKSQLVSRIADYCRVHEGFQDVLVLCGTKTEPDDSHTAAESKKIVEIGYVYLAKSGRFFKIGHSNSAGRREWELGIQLPERIKLVHVIKAIDDPVGLEAYWHRRFNAKRKNGEWFDLEAADVAAFKRRKFM